MDGARRVRPRRDWAAILAAQGASGQTAGVYCREHDIPYKSFLYHRRKHRAAQDASESCDVHVQRPRSVFAKLHVSAARLHAIVRIPGVEVACEGLPDPSWLTELAYKLAREVA